MNPALNQGILGPPPIVAGTGQAQPHGPLYWQQTGLVEYDEVIPGRITGVQPINTVVAQSNAIVQPGIYIVEWQWMNNNNSPSLEGQFGVLRAVGGFQNFSNIGPQTLLFDLQQLLMLRVGDVIQVRISVAMVLGDVVVGRSAHKMLHYAT